MVALIARPRDYGDGDPGWRSGSWNSPDLTPGYCISSLWDFGGSVALKNLLSRRDTDNGPVMFKRWQR
jgi:hypothetical protein